MKATVGDHVGTSMELLMLKRPDYINWLLSFDAKGRLALMKNEVLRLVGIFDTKQFLTPCSSTDCTDQSVKVSVHGEELSTMCWCEDCDPYSLGAKPGKIRIIRTYRGALNHVTKYCGGGKENYLEVIQKLSRYKGFVPEQGVKAAEAQAFFTNDLPHLV